MGFNENLNYGLAGESIISKWLISKGYSVLPAYEKIINTGKGPRLFTDKGNIISPDLLTWKSNDIFWVEAKRKTAFSWHRNTEKFVTGIDRHHYRHYLRVNNETPWKVWLLFLHDGGMAKDSPPSPAGLFGNSLDFLKTNINHYSDNWGNSGMVYWAIESLLKLSNIEEMEIYK